MFCGVDYSSSSIYMGWVNKHKLIRTQTIDIINLSGGLELLEKLLLDDPDISLWVEKPWVSSSFFPRSAIMLARTAGMIEAIAVRAGIVPNFVLPNVWRKRVYGTARVEDRKEAARKLAEELFGFETKHKNQNDICEAILISHYGELVSLEGE